MGMPIRKFDASSENVGLDYQHNFNNKEAWEKGVLPGLYSGQLSCPQRRSVVLGTARATSTAGNGAHPSMRSTTDTHALHSRPLATTANATTALAVSSAVSSLAQ